MNNNDDMSWDEIRALAGPYQKNLNYLRTQCPLNTYLRLKVLFGAEDRSHLAKILALRGYRIYDNAQLSKVPCTLAPCSNCPFTVDSPRGWLGHRIESDLQADTFVCHKTVNATSGRLQCAGHMMLTEDDNTMVALAKLWDILPEFKGRERVFKTRQACIEHHKAQ